MAARNSIGSFDRRIGVLAVAMDKNATKVLRTVSMAVDQTVVLATPVDTGRAKTNWLAGINAPRRETVAPLDKSGQGGIAAASAVVGQAKTDDIVWISNNLSYIRLLNQGHSSQAPPGYVEKAVRAALAAAKSAGLLKTRVKSGS